ncbi:MAG: catalase-related domain-containing protein, partial [Dietzia sp.]
DGMHQTADHVGVAPYKPNSLDGGCPFLAGADDGALVEVAQHIADAQVVRDAPATFDDHYSQATLFYSSMTDVEKEHIAGAYAFELGKCYEENIKIRQVEQLAHIDHDLAVTVATGLGLPAPAKVPVADVVTSPALSQIGREWPSDGRLIGILVTEASDVAAVKMLEQAVFADDMVPLVIAPTGGRLGEGDPDATVAVSRTYQTQRSIEFDALVVVDLPANPRTDILISEMFRHKKAIASLAPVDQFVDFGLTADTPGVVVVDEAAGVLPALKPLLATHRAWDRPDPARI